MEREIMHKSIISRLMIFLLVLVIAAGAAGCNLGTPVCPDGSLQAVALGAPQNGTITNNLTPVLSWSYPGTTCHPEGYRVDLSTVENISQVWTGTTGGTSTTWGPATPLLPGKEYEWWVFPYIGTHYGPQSNLHLFFTGPMCATASLHAPSLVSPQDGSVVTDLNPTLIWEYPDPCLPQGYRIDLSTEITFSDTSLAGGTGDPSSRWNPSVALADCTTYFWRVAPINGTSLGSYSGVNFFSTNREQECSPEATATVQGFLWYDQCSVPLEANPAPNPLPAGCLVDAYGVDADRVHQPGEPYMAGITVNIGPGDCPSGGTRSTLTDANGAYTFSGLTPGKYCINVNAASFLGPSGTGHWTIIPSGHEGNTYRAITIAAGQVLTGQGFAWYQFTGAAPPPTTVPGFDFVPSLNANCHTGPGLIFDTLDLALKGQSYPVDGRDLDGTWLRLMLTPTRGCWVRADTGTLTGDIAGVRVLISPPTPTPTAVVACASYKDEKSCEAQLVCQWKQSSLGAAVTYYCTDK